jgi:MFS family permease
MSGINVMVQYQSYFGVASLGGATGLIFSLFYAGAFTAIISGPFLADKWGRKMPIKVGSLVALAGAIIQASSQNIEQFRAARFILGYGSSLCFAYGPLYTVEMAHPFWRGRLGGLLMIGVLGGNTFSLWMDFACSWATGQFAWRFPVRFFNPTPS